MRIRFGCISYEHQDLSKIQAWNRWRPRQFQELSPILIRVRTNFRRKHAENLVSLTPAASVQRFGDLLKIGALQHAGITVRG